jgi:GNAT superfamily N-acetyltransferase
MIRATHAVTCFYIRSGYRKDGLMARLLEAGVDHVRTQGAAFLDACPIESDKPLQWGEGFVGIASVFRRSGFEEIARRSPKRPLMRRKL